MIVDKVEIKLKGKHAITKLAELNYRPYRTKQVWVFEGVMHHYIFKSVDNTHITITITAKNKDIQLEHIITFAQIQDWVGQSVSKIQIDGRK